MTNKEQFLIEHNKLSPLSLQADLTMLTRFKEEKTSLFKDDNWSIDKLRRPFILWLTSLPSEQPDDISKQPARNAEHSSAGGERNKSAKQFHPYPTTKV